MVSVSSGIEASSSSVELIVNSILLNNAPAFSICFLSWNLLHTAFPKHYFPTLFPIRYGIPKLGLRKLSLKVTQFQSVQMIATLLFWLVAEQWRWLVLLLHVLKVGRFSLAGYTHHQACMNTAYPVKVFSFFPSCVAPIESGVIADWKLNGCTGSGNSEACACVNLFF